ncbi:DNA polymerase IV [Nesterenkonia populi]
MASERCPDVGRAGDGVRSPVIAHVDMDAFYVEAELLGRPELRGRKLIVAAAGRSVVLSASYEARADGVRSAMPLSRAQQISPQSLVLEPHMGLYRELSAGIMAYFDTITAAKEQLSVDEAFLDLTGAQRLMGSPQRMGERLRTDIRAQFGLPASVGIADRKFIAKIASQRAKPDGLLLVPPAARLRFLHSLPVNALWGVGAKTAAALEQIGLRTVEQVAQTPREALKQRFGATGEHLHDLAWGHDSRPVTPHREEKSIGAEETFEADLSEDADLHAELLDMAHRVAARLRAAEASAQGVALKLRYKDFTTLTRSSTLHHPTQSAPVLYDQARRLLAGLGERPQPVRLVGLRAERLSRDAAELQLALALDADAEHSAEQAGAWVQAEQALDAVAHRFPKARVQPASVMRRHARGQPG